MAASADNAAADLLNRVISALMSGGVSAAEAELAVLAPGLQQVPVVGWLIDEGITYLAQVLSIATQKFADAVVIDIQTNGERSAVLTAVTELAFAQASGSTAAITHAIGDANAAWKAAINFDGWSTPA